MTKNNLEFKDTMSYQAPESPDCLMVPEAQWDELHGNLKKTSPFRDHLLWMLCGVCGGGTISCWATYIAFPDNVEHILKLTFFILGIVLPLATLILLILALKLGSEVTAESVREQMTVLKKGFRKLTTPS
jgi:hypothetical protein